MKIVHIWISASIVLALMISLRIYNRVDHANQLVSWQRHRARTDALIAEARAEDKENERLAKEPAKLAKAWVFRLSKDRVEMVARWKAVVQRKDADPSVIQEWEKSELNHIKELTPAASYVARSEVEEATGE